MTAFSSGLNVLRISAQEKSGRSRERREKPRGKRVQETTGPAGGAVTSEAALSTRHFQSSKYQQSLSSEVLVIKKCMCIFQNKSVAYLYTLTLTIVVGDMILAETVSVTWLQIWRHVAK